MANEKFGAREAALLFTCIAMLGQLSASQADSRVALVIGNADYATAPLRNPVNDARAIARTLQRLQFDVIRVENAGRAEMEQAIIEFTNRLGKDVSGLFYYAGHGVQVKGRNYLIPVDATLDSEREVRVEAIDVDLVLSELEYAENRLNIIILDACRNNPFERRFRGRSRGLAAVDAARGSLIAYATAPGAVALDGDGDNGVYTEELLRVLEVPGLGVEQVFKRVRVKVAERTDSKQIPWESSSLTGEFVFRPATGAESVATGGTVAGDRNGELLFWESIKASDNADVFRAYLQQYPDGLFTSLAQIKLEELGSPPIAGAVPEPASDSALSLANTGGGDTSAATDSISAGASASDSSHDSGEPSRAATPPRIALLPPNTRNLCGECDTEGEVSALAGEFFRNHEELELTHAYQSARLGVASVPYSSDLWKGTYVKKEPNEGEVIRIGKATGVDAVLMYVYQSILTKGAWDGGAGQVQVFLFDVRAQSVHRQEGARSELRKMTEEVVGEYLQSPLRTRQAEPRLVVQ